MARPRGKKFQADVIIDGVRKRPTFDTLEEAVAYERSVELGLPEAGAVTFKKFHETHFDFIWGDNKAPQATRYGLDALDQFIPAGKPLSEISSAFVIEMVSKMKSTGVSNATINRRLSVLSKLLKHGEKLELCRKPTFDFLKENEGRERVLSRVEEAKMFQFFDHMGLRMSGAIVKFLLYTGCRLGEVYTLSRDRVSDGRVTFHYTVTKTSKTRLVPLVGPAEDAWKLACKLSDLDTPFSGVPRDTFRGHWNRFREHMGLLEDDEFVPHMLRHTCASRLVSKGVPLPQVMQWMGHRNIMTTMRYSHLAPKDLDMAAKALMDA
jgi:integrase